MVTVMLRPDDTVMLITLVGNFKSTIVGSVLLYDTHKKFDKIPTLVIKLY